MMEGERDKRGDPGLVPSLFGTLELFSVARSPIQTSVRGECLCLCIHHSAFSEVYGRLAPDGVV